MVNDITPNIPSDFTGYNGTGASIPAFSAVRVVGATNDVARIALAQADDADDMPCAGITIGEIEDGCMGTVRRFGLIYDIDTSAFAAGDNLYVDGTVAGGIVASNNPPADIMQRVGAVLVSDAVAGQVFVCLDPMLDGHVSYTNRDQFEIFSTGTTPTLQMSGSGGGALLEATPTGVRHLTFPDATTNLVGDDTTDLLTNKTFDSVHILSSGAAFDLMVETNEALTADRRLRINLGDANRQLDLLGSATITGGAHSGTNTGDQTLTEVIALADLTDVTAKTGTGTVVVMQGSPSLTTPSIGDFTNATHTHADNAGGGKLNVATALGAGSPGHTLKTIGTAPAWTPAGILFRREWQFTVDPAAATATRTNLVTAPTLSGTVSNQDNATRPLLRHVTGSVSGNSAGVLSGFDVTRAGWLSKQAFVYQPGNLITSGRWWCGMTTADLTGIATPTTQNVAAFGYDTGIDGSVVWYTVTCNGTSATRTATAVTFSASTTYNLRIEINGATNVLFYIDDVLVRTETATLPAALLGFQMSVTTLSAATRRFEWSRAAGELI